MKPRTKLLQFAPALVLGVGVLGTIGVSRQRAMPLRAPLDSVIPMTIDDYTGRDVILSDEEETVAGMDRYLMRSYTSVTDSLGFSLYVGYYRQQARGRTIHSPKNCLPGGGWDALASQEIQIQTSLGTVPVNRYLLQKNQQQALVLYWYQGRGRVTANEYRVKWNLLRDAALRQRSEEALVRIVVPIDPNRETDAAFRTAEQAARVVVPSLARALPD